MIFKGKTILIISPEAWGENFVSKHHYASELSKSNKVYFLNPPGADFLIDQITDNLKIIHYKPTIRGVNWLPAIGRDLLNKLTIKKIKSKLQLRDFDVVWSFDPFRFQNLKLFKNSYHIYHPVDVHYTALEKEIVTSADLVLTSCDVIKKKLLPLNPNVHKIGHGISERFIKASFPLEKKSLKIKACMMGNLQRKIDYPVLFNLIQVTPNVEFHFIGPYESSNLSKTMSYSTEIERLKSYSNTFLHGSIPQHQMPDILKEMDLFLVLYHEDENPAARANPHKMLEYLGTGKMILSTWTEEYAHESQLLKMVKNNEEFILAFKEVLDHLEIFNSEELIMRRIHFAKKNTYGDKIKMIENLIAIRISK